MLGPLALDDVRVLDLSEGIAGPLAARLIGDFGADVIKVEPPGGEIGRRTPPFFQDDPDPEKSLFYLMLNLNKRGITLNLDTDEGAAILRRLARDVDVIVESFPPGYLAARGTGLCQSRAGKPGPGDDLDHAVRADRAVQPLPGRRDHRLRDQRHDGDQRHGRSRAAEAWRISRPVRIRDERFPGDAGGAVRARHDRRRPAGRSVDPGRHRLQPGAQPALSTASPAAFRGGGIRRAAISAR